MNQFTYLSKSDKETLLKMIAKGEASIQELRNGNVKQYLESHCYVAINTDSDALYLINGTRVPAEEYEVKTAGVAPLKVTITL